MATIASLVSCLGQAMSNKLLLGIRRHVSFSGGSVFVASWNNVLNSFAIG